MPPADPGRLRGTYRPPRARVGAVLTCQARECQVVVTGFSAGPIRWPVGRRAGGRAPGVPGLVVCGGLAEAVRREARQAVARAWGASLYTVTLWRRALGVRPPAAERARRSAAARRQAASFLPKGRRWTPAEDAAVRGWPPRDAARLTGRSVSAVYNRRLALGLPDARTGGRPPQGAAPPTVPPVGPPAPDPPLR